MSRPLDPLEGTLVVSEQPGRRGASGAGEVAPPPGLLLPLLYILTRVSQGVAFKFLIGVESLVGPHGGEGVVLVLVWLLDSSLEHKVHPARLPHSGREMNLLQDFGVAWSGGAHNMDARAEQAPVVSVFSWREISFF